MIRESSGKIAENLYALGMPNLPVYLFTGSLPVLFDAGMSFMGPRYLKAIEDHLGDAQRLAYLLLTHSHYDHCGSAPYLKRKISALKIGSSHRAAEVFKKPKARQLIQSLSTDAIQKYKPPVDEGEIIFESLEVDLLLNEGDELDLGYGQKIRVLATPGHTRDALSFYLPAIKALIPGEAVGVFDNNLTLFPQFLSNYGDYMASLEKLARLEVAVIALAHGHVITGSDAQGLIAKSIKQAREFQNRIQKYLADAGRNPEVVIERIYQEDYVRKKLIRQDARPFLINLSAMVKGIAEN